MVVGPFFRRHLFVCALSCARLLLRSIVIVILFFIFFSHVSYNRIKIAMQVVIKVPLFVVLLSSSSMLCRMMIKLLNFTNHRSNVTKNSAQQQQPHRMVQGEKKAYFIYKNHQPDTDNRQIRRINLNMHLFIACMFGVMIL